MAKIRVHSDRVEIKLSAVEKTLSFHRKDIVIRRSDITSAVITDEPWGWMRGARSPGNSVPYSYAFGTWKFYGGKDFLLLRGRRRRAVVIDIEVEDIPEQPTEPVDVVGEEAVAVDEVDRFSRIIVSTEHAAKLVTALRLNHTGEVHIAAPGKP
ncbi:hypothetical protein [Lysinibacter sp. HNR]|uniref:hypothetical protein n=1 Tax=Lysinibacter sp. HNR TaxID=3031408 RepID=UPI00243590D1|nr:hypothetical protein [Lysinibacter sp. HNR]WGD37653.1 hypothetical protein FrondiHNR_01685 [Lysinibacter sp. HNR]